MPCLLVCGNLCGNIVLGGVSLTAQCILKVADLLLFILFLQPFQQKYATLCRHRSHPDLVQAVA